MFLHKRDLTLTFTIKIGLLTQSPLTKILNFAKLSKANSIKVENEQLYYKL